MALKFRIIPIIASLIFSAAMFATTTNPAFAANGNGPAYRFTLERPVTGNKVAAEAVWSCNDTGCATANVTSRPAIVCAKAARELGKLTSFTIRGQDLDAEALAKCNTKAR
jgi:hypothetical protein